MYKLDFFPYSEQSGKGKIKLPQRKIEIYETINSQYKEYYEELKKERKKKNINIDIDKLVSKNTSERYSIEEIKNIAGNLGITGVSIMPKKDIIKLILLELDKE